MMASSSELRIFPPEIYLLCPVVITKRQCFSVDLVHMAYDFIEGAGSASGVAEVIQKARTNKYITTMSVYYGHCRCWIAWDIITIVA